MVDQGHADSAVVQGTQIAERQFGPGFHHLPLFGLQRGILNRQNAQISLQADTNLL